MCQAVLYSIHVVDVTTYNGTVYLIFALGPGVLTAGLPSSR